MSPSPKTMQQLAATAQGQFGVFSRGQALHFGVGSSTLAGWVTNGRHRHVLPGVMGPEVPESWEMRAMAALLAVGGRVVLARQSAARLHGLDLPSYVPDEIALLVHNRTFPTLPSDIRVHRTRRLPDNHITRVGNFPATIPERTLADLAGSLGPEALRRSTAHAVRNDLIEVPVLRTVVCGLGRIRGKRNLLRVCDELSPLEHECNSELESRFLNLMTVAGLPPTAMNHPVVDADGRQRYIDAVYLPHKVGVELDSKLAHGSRIDRNEDRVRERAIVNTGWPPLHHFTWQDVTQRSAYVIDTVRAAVAAAEADLRDGPGR